MLHSVSYSTDFCLNKEGPLSTGIVDLEQLIPSIEVQKKFVAKKHFVPLENRFLENVSGKKKTQRIYEDIFYDTKEWFLAQKNLWVLYRTYQDSIESFWILKALRSTTAESLSYIELVFKDSDWKVLLDFLQPRLSDLPWDHISAQATLLVVRGAWDVAPNVQVTYDMVEFLPIGDVYTIGAVVYSQPMETLETFLSSAQKELNRFSTYPALSKILEYLRRHQPQIFGKLKELKMVTESENQPDWQYLHMMLDERHWKSRRNAKLTDKESFLIQSYTLFGKEVDPSGEDLYRDEYFEEEEAAYEEEEMSSF